MAKDLITASFAKQALAFPGKVDQALAELSTAEQAKDLLDRGKAMQKYAEQLRAGIEVERPIAIGVLKIKAKLGELMPRHQGKKLPDSGLGSFSDKAIATYRKLHDQKDRLNKYCDEITDDVPSQAGFLKWVSGGSHVSNNSGDNEWYTPQDLIERARAVLGVIDLDPASSDKAQQVVQASCYYTAKDDGLSKPWRGNVWMNPPYSRDKVGRFAAKLVEEFDAKHIIAAIVLTNNSTDADWFQLMESRCSCLCFPARRVQFTKPGTDELGKPLQGQVLTYLGTDVDGFANHFREIGFAVCPHVAT